MALCVSSHIQKGERVAWIGRPIKAGNIGRHTAKPCMAQSDAAPQGRSTSESHSLAGKHVPVARLWVSLSLGDAHPSTHEAFKVDIDVSDSRLAPHLGR